MSCVQNQCVRVAIVDDDVAMLNLLQRFLMTDFRDELIVQQYENPQQVLGMSVIEPIDIILTDLDMPSWNGFKLLKELRKRNPLTQVVIVSAQATNNAIHSAFTLGASEFLMKPINRQDLRMSLEYLVARILRLRSYLNQGT